MEARSDPDKLVSDDDVTRVVKRITEKKSRCQVFSKQSGMSANLSGEGVELEVCFARSGGMPVTCVSDGPDAPSGGVVDLQKKYYLTASELATKLGLTPRAAAVRRHVGADTNPDLSNAFHFRFLAVVMAVQPALLPVVFWVEYRGSVNAMVCVDFKVVFHFESRKKNESRLISRRPHSSRIVSLLRDNSVSGSLCVRYCWGSQGCLE